MVKQRKRLVSLSVLWRTLGPGLVTGAADDDPSGIATYSQAGAQFGYTLLWTVFLTLPFMAAIQIISACIGWNTRQGLARNIGRMLPSTALYILVATLLVANTINIAADLAAMGEALRLVAGGSALIFAVLFGAGCLIAEILIPYHRYAGYLKLLTLVLLFYVAAAFSVDIPWNAVAWAALVPHPSLDHDVILMVVAVFGTTISPYLFFWQSAQEVEEVDQKPEEKPLLEAPRQAPEAIERIRIDTIAGMAMSNLIALAIMIATAATLHAYGVTHIESAAQAASALKPIAGEFAFALFAIGIIGTGLLAIPVLAGSAAYAVAGSFNWRNSLELQPSAARKFYGIIVAATLGGALIGFLPIDPIKALYWSAVINGMLAVPVMVVLMLMARHRGVMGHFVIGGPLYWLGWLSTAAMAVSVAAMAVGWFV